MITITNTITNWINKELIMVDFPPQPWWENDVFWQIVGAVAIPIFLSLWAWFDNVKKDKESARKDELNILLKYIERNVNVLSSIHRNEHNESTAHLLKFLRKETKFLLNIERMMGTMQYYNRSWIFKNALALLIQTEAYRDKFSAQLIEELEKNIATFIDHISSFLLQDEKSTQEDLNNLEDTLFDKDLKTRIDKEIKNIDK